MINFNIIHAKSIKNTFEFINYTTISGVQLVFNDGDDKREIWFDYDQFLELADFIEQLKQKI
jgi:hypothetical protein